MIDSQSSLEEPEVNPATEPVHVSSALDELFAGWGR